MIRAVMAQSYPVLVPRGLMFTGIGTVFNAGYGAYS
jgi:hypothetical protein